MMKNDWVEVVDDEIALRRIANPLLQVVKIDRQRRTIELNEEPGPEAGRDPKKHPILRRWADKPQRAEARRSPSPTPPASVVRVSVIHQSHHWPRHA
jgi:hypothetical protein